jgi:hypothetical protein
MCPMKCPGLSTCWGEEFEKLYLKYVPNFKWGIFYTTII